MLRGAVPGCGLLTIFGFVPLPLPRRHLQALNDSRLGDAVIGGGMDDDLKQPCFTVGLKGVDAANVDKVGVVGCGRMWRGMGVALRIRRS